MEQAQTKRLREPFPPSAVGKLPKAGMMLDYVGHAATTDRLLEVDPDWTWEPFALDDAGLPALDSDGNLWIRLTVCGVTRPGVGDGKTAKEHIGDAIRNAAMRFGVALDLWAKEDLQANGHDPDPAKTLMERQKQRIQQRQKPETPTSDPSGTEASPAQRKKLDVLVGKLRPDHLKTEHLYSAVANIRQLDVATIAALIGGTDQEGVYHWAPLRDSLTKQEASDLIERLGTYEKNVQELGS